MFILTITANLFKVVFYTNRLAFFSDLRRASNIDFDYFVLYVLGIVFSNEISLISTKNTGMLCHQTQSTTVPDNISVLSKNLVEKKGESFMMFYR